MSRPRWRQSAVPVLEVTAVPAATSTPLPFVPFTVTTWADNVVLHDNPGHLAPKLGILADNTPLTVARTDARRGVADG